MQTIEKIYITTAGDSSIGFPSATYIISGNVIIDPNMMIENDIRDYLEEQREIIRKTFIRLLDNNSISVFFDFELS